MINFVKYRYVCLLGTLALFGAALGYYVYQVQTRGYAFKYSVDFTGGTQVLLKFNNPVSSAHVRESIEAAGWAGAITREFSSNEVLVRVKEFSNDSQGLAERMKGALNQSFPDNTVQILQSESVGAGIGESLRWNAFYAVLIAVIAILFYVAIRSWSIAYAVGAVVALIHDPLAILSVFLLLDREISIAVISAIIAVLGYSINDTIVIFSRIRENQKKMKGQSLSVIVNESLNKTLRRTILTSISTALTVGAMFVLGGEALHDFSLALLVGIIFGTYSSIYIASPIMMLLYKES